MFAASSHFTRALTEHNKEATSTHTPVGLPQSY